MRWLRSGCANGSANARHRPVRQMTRGTSRVTESARKRQGLPVQPTDGA
ncbi:hypothetical protein [Caudoviricetes sp.]|nr:hypothetical protein [Caudoviricetes sp.]